MMDMDAVRWYYISPETRNVNEKEKVKLKLGKMGFHSQESIKNYTRVVETRCTRREVKQQGGLWENIFISIRILPHSSLSF